MNHPKIASVLLVLALLVTVAISGSFIGTVSAEQDLAVSGIDVTPSDPAPGEPVTFEITIQNLESSDETVEIMDVFVRHPGGSGVRELARAEDLGSIAVGGSMSVPLSLSFDESGRKDLRVHVVARDSDGFDSFEYPVQVTVSRPNNVPVAISADEFVAGEQSVVNVTVANGREEPISNIELVLESDGRVDNPRRVSGSIPSNTDREYTYHVTFDKPGTGTINASLRYSVAGDITRAATTSMPVSVGVSNDVQVAISADEFIAGEGTAVNVTVANGRHTPISNIELVLNSDGTVDNPRRVSGLIQGDTDREYGYQVSFDEPGSGTLNASLQYRIGSGRVRTVSASLPVTIGPFSQTTAGRIQLTGVETSAVGDSITIEGEAANVGTTDAVSVLLTIQAGDGVTPVQPSKEYFVGTVEGSEFGTFELTARVDPSVSSVPVLVEWTVDGDDRLREVIDVDVSDARTSFDDQPSRPGRDSAPGGPLAILGNSGLIGLVILVVVGVFIGLYYRWKRQ